MDQGPLSFREILDLSPIAMVVVNGRGTIVFFNRQAEAVFGYAQDEVQGKAVEFLVPEKFKQIHEEHRKDFSKAPEDRLMGHGRELFARRKGGTEFPVEIGLSSATISGELLIIATIVDITQRKVLEDQLVRVQKLEALGHLASGIAHEMNNVLSAIGAIALNQLSLTVEEERRTEAFRKIDKVVRRGGAVVSSLLHLARHEQTVTAKFDCNTLIREQMSLLSHSTLARVEVAISLSEEPVLVNGDEAALGHAVMNLCINALDAMEGTTSGSRLHLSAGRQGNWVTIEVSDNGPGMSEDVKRHSLDAFFTTKAAGKGTGLGLAIVSNIVRSHGGLLGIETSPGNGCRVTISIPALRDEEAEASPANTEPPPGGRQGRILVVDDDAIVLESLGALISSQGFQVTLAEGSQKALELLASAATFDLVVLDVNMPGIDGREVHRKVRRVFPDLPILMYSGLIDSDLISVVENSPHTLLISKPAKFEVLMDSMTRLLAGA